MLTVDDREQPVTDWLLDEILGGKCPRLPPHIRGADNGDDDGNAAIRTSDGPRGGGRVEKNESKNDDQHAERVGSIQRPSDIRTVRGLTTGRA